MKLICLVKFVPDTSKFIFNFENNTVVRDNVRMILNTEDAMAMAFALEMKRNDPEIVVEAISMGPMSVIRMAEDLVRMGVDKLTLISDKLFAGSDSYATSRILGEYLTKIDFDCLLTGTHAIDGDTSHVPSQIADLLNLPQMSNVTVIDQNEFNNEYAVFRVDEEYKSSKYKMSLPGVISLSKDSKYKLPYIKYEDLNKDVKAQISILSNNELKLDENAVGIKGSLTKVNRTFVKEYARKNSKIVSTDEEGINCVYDFLKENNYLQKASVYEKMFNLLRYKIF